MANTESKQQYEGAILQQLIKNSERLVIVEQDSIATQAGCFATQAGYDSIKTGYRVNQTKSRKYRSHFGNCQMDLGDDRSGYSS